MRRLHINKLGPEPINFISHHTDLLSHHFHIDTTEERLSDAPLPRQPKRLVWREAAEGANIKNPFTQYRYATLFLAKLVQQEMLAYAGSLLTTIP